MALCRCQSVIRRPSNDLPPEVFQGHQIYTRKISPNLEQVDQRSAYGDQRSVGQASLIHLSLLTLIKNNEDDIWIKIVEEAEADAEEEPFLHKYYYDLILSHASLESALANHLANKLTVPNSLPVTHLYKLFHSVLREEEIMKAVRADLEAARDWDPACSNMAHCFLHYKGFLTCQAHRVAHWLWEHGRAAGAFMVQSRVSEVFAVDIHPGARIGAGVLLDHATGVVIGETAVVGDDVLILHNVTLGGTGKAVGDRHPKIGDGVLVGAGTQILGNVRIGEGAKVGAGSVVLKDVPARTTAVGNPARLIGRKATEHTSWSDYVI